MNSNRDGLTTATVLKNVVSCDGSSAPKVLPAPTAPGFTMQEAWESFRKDCPEHFSEGQIESEWFRILGEMFPDKTPEQLSPQEWVRFAAEATVRIIPTLPSDGDSCE